jgi:hypothetical protein
MQASHKAEGDLCAYVPAYVMGLQMEWDRNGTNIMIFLFFFFCAHQCSGYYYEGTAAYK